MQILPILLSGLIGAFIATLLSIFYNYVTERIHRRAEVMVQVTSWLDDIYDRLQAIHVDKGAQYTNKKRGLTDDEYRLFSREIKTMLISTKIHTSVALVYGEDVELGMINEVTKQLSFITEMLWSADIDNWVESNNKIHNHFKSTIDPLRASIIQKFLSGTNVSSVMSDFLRHNLPTFYKISKKHRI